MQTIKTSAKTSSISRTIINPVLKDEVTFIETSRESNGVQTLVEVTLAPGGGNPIHYHKGFSEEFTCQEGELSIQLGKQIICLKPGESATAPAYSKHRFFNQSNRPCRFQCRVSPGFVGFEQTLQIMYGLARDGETNSKGMPKSLYALGYIVMNGDTNMVGWMAILQPLVNWFGRRAVKNGIAAELQRRYMTIW